MSRGTFSCYLIGGDSLLIQCADLLLDAGHEIRGVITAAAPIQAWCAERDIRTIDAGDDYVAHLEAEPFDYLFAITHLAIIPERALELPRKLAVNFHDGPLPRYAGLNTPVWALINGESEYGISWHVMTAGIDRGDILVQKLFDIAPNETALSLNTKCMAAAVETFPELVAGLVEGRTAGTPQDASQRSYFGKFTRPAGASSIDWRRPATEISALVRALSFGPYPNPVGVAKAVAGTSEAAPFVVTAADVTDSESAAGSQPGEVIGVAADGIVVATGEGAVTIRGAHSLHGHDLGLLDLGLAVGTRLGPEPAAFEALTRLDEELCRGEDFWAGRLRAADTPEVPLMGPPTDSAPQWYRLSVSVADSIAARFGEAREAAVLTAFAIYLARTGRKEAFQLGAKDSSVIDGLAGLEDFYAPVVPLSVALDPEWTTEEAVGQVAEEVARLRSRRTFLRDLAGRIGVAASGDGPTYPVGVGLGSVDDISSTPPGGVVSLVIGEGGDVALILDASRIPEASGRSMVDSLQVCLEEMARLADEGWTRVPLVPKVALDELTEWNSTTVESDVLCIHEAFEAQVQRTPDAPAVVFEGESISYRELDFRANALAGYLKRHGAGPGALVGVHVERSLDLLVATLGVLKSGGAYLPLDPHFPPDRIALMIEDSGAGVIITQSRLRDDLPRTSAHLVRIDSEWDAISKEGSEHLDSGASPSDIAYAIYTSGSTGTPKGVLIEHRNVDNFFTGMDAVIRHDPPGVWLAVTSLSFDISVLELFWTLARGFQVVVFSDGHRLASSTESAVSKRGMDFGLFMWGNDDGPGRDKYRLMLEGARYFDENGFDSVWTPERHFHAFGGPFPNPAVTSAAIAAVTENISIRSGSCVSPLHHPVRVAEEWAVVDNLSNGRVGISFAAGWQPNDFVLRPENFPGQKKIMLEQIETIRRLWRGETIEFENPMGEMVGVTTLPRPVQPELPFWMTTAGNPESYRAAGAMGANVLTHLLGQSVDEVAEKIAVYREARREAGLDPDEGVVSLMLHTYVGDDDDEVRELVRQPMKDYLGASMKLVLGFAWSFPAFKRPGGADATPDDLDLSELSAEETDAILDFAFERYFETSGLFGTPETCAAMVDKCKAIGVDEIACLLDFGVDTELVMSSLPGLKVVRDAANRAVEEGPVVDVDHSFATQIRRHGVTHLQCTPSMARLLVEDPDSRAALRDVEHLMIGGEAFPPPLADELSTASVGSITNMYGPTETTIWSSTAPVEGGMDPIPIGRPIANTQLYVLDRYLNEVPHGVPGELYIGGSGVARGYHGRPELTAERFVDDPFKPGARMYRTGDLACYRRDGALDFLGRVDHQVKIRGYRIELGEIEAKLDAHPSVRVSAVVLREDVPGDQRLVAYVVGAPTGDVEATLRMHLRETLPEYMIPGHVVSLDRMPLTPNGKIDRGALPAPATTTDPAVLVEPEAGLERTIATCWQEVLKRERVGADENFFDIGGHSLLVVQLHRVLTEAIEQPISLVDLYRFPTVRSLGEHLGTNGKSVDLGKSEARAEKRKAGLAARRRRRN